MIFPDGRVRVFLYGRPVSLREAGADVAVIELSGAPSQVLSITASLISSVAHFGINFLQCGMHISDYWCYIGIPILHIKHRNCRVTDSAITAWARSDARHTDRLGLSQVRKYPDNSIRSLN